MRCTSNTFHTHVEMQRPPSPNTYALHVSLHHLHVTIPPCTCFEMRADGPVCESQIQASIPVSEPCHMADICSICVLQKPLEHFSHPASHQHLPILYLHMFPFLMIVGRLQSVAASFCRYRFSENYASVRRHGENPKGSFHPLQHRATSQP